LLLLRTYLLEGGGSGVGEARFAEGGNGEAGAGNGEGGRGLEGKHRLL